MPRYYFHRDDHRPFFVDESEGVDLPDDAAARAHADTVARELRKKNESDDLTIVVTNAEGKTVCKVSVRRASGRCRNKLSDR